MNFNSENMQAQLAKQLISTAISNVSINGRPSKRLILIFRTNGCRRYENGNGCTMCGFQSMTIGRDKFKITAGHLKAQFDKGISTAGLNRENYEQIDLLMPGSFLDDHEVPPEFRIHAMQKIAEMPHIQKVLIESRTEYVTSERLKMMKTNLREDQLVELAVGVETSNEHLRNDILKKNMSWSELENALRICAEHNVGFQAYLLIKPPALSEQEAIADAVNSAKDIASLAHSVGIPFRIAFEPVFIPRNTKLEKAHQNGEYKIVNLWSVVEVIKQASNLDTIIVGLDDERLSNNRNPSSCEFCTKKIRQAIEEFNALQDIRIFDGLSCSCKKRWRKKTFQ